MTKANHVKPWFWKFSNYLCSNASNNYPKYKYPIWKQYSGLSVWLLISGSRFNPSQTPYIFDVCTIFLCKWWFEIKPTLNYRFTEMENKIGCLWNKENCHLGISPLKFGVCLKTVFIIYLLFYKLHYLFTSYSTNVPMSLTGGDRQPDTDRDRRDRFGQDYADHPVPGRSRVHCSRQDRLHTAPSCGRHECR